MSEHLRHLVAARTRPAVRACPTPACRMLGRDGAHYPLTPDELADAHDDLHPRVRARARRRLLRHDAGAPARGRRPRAAAASVAARKPRPRAGRRVALPARAVPPGHVVPVHRRAHERQRLARRSATRCSPSAGTTASRSPATRPATAPTCSTSASTTSGATASPTCARSSAGSRPRRRCRSCSTRPSRPCSRPGSSCSAAARSSTRVNYEDGDGPGSRASPGSCRSSREHGAAVVALTIDEEGQARTADWKVARRRAAHRRPHRRRGACASRTSSSTA